MAREIYADRQEAGRMLAEAVGRDLADELRSGRALVLAIPRGGVVLGSEVAQALDADLDIVVPRKLGSESNPEYGIGAVMHDGTRYLNPRALQITGASSAYIEEETARQMKEAFRRLSEYRGGRKEPEISGRVVVIVDDGIATGATMLVALRWVRSHGARVVVAAAPVAPQSTIDELRPEADRVVCPRAPEPFQAIGAFYERFDQVSDGEVKEILRENWERPPRTSGP